jgi:hypothetical protein
MKQAFTQEDLLLYFYGETSPLEQMALQHALDHDWGLKQKAAELNEVKSMLDEVSFEPSPTSIKIILDHNRSAESVS